MNHFVRDDCLEPNDQDECEYISARFMMLAGPDSPQKTIKIRDYYNDQTRDIHDMLYFELPTDDELWKFLSRPVCKFAGKPLGNLEPELISF